MRKALNAGADPNFQYQREWTALLAAAARPTPQAAEVAELLLDAGARVDAKDEDGKMALGGAASNDDDEFVTLLLRAGAPVNYQDSYGNSPLHLSVIGGSLSCTMLLMKHGADPSVQDGRGRTPYSIAEKGENAAIIEFLDRARSTRSD